EGRSDQALTDVSHSREIIAELIAGIRPDDSPLAKQVLGIYLFLFSAATEVRLAKDCNRLTDMIRVLEEEQLTWGAVCEQMPERSAPATAISAEEVAPQRVDANWTPVYGHASPCAAA